MDPKEKVQIIQRFSKRYGLSSLTHPSQYQSPNKKPTPPSCLFERLPEYIVHDILSRLSIPDLLMAGQSCVAWHRIVSLCPIFQQLYDERNHQPWIALTATSPNNPDGFVLFNANDANHCYFLSLAQHLAAPMTTSWLLKGVADGLMLLASTQGRLAVVNPLTRRIRLLPDAKITPRLRLESCLKKKLWHHDHLPSISMNIAVDLGSKTFKVMVLGEVRINQVHALIYSSLTDTWTIKLCPEIDHKLFRRFFHSTVHGKTIYCTSIYPLTINCTSIYPKWMVSYNTETQLSVIEEIPLMDFSEIGRTRFRRVQTIGIVGYENRIFVLGVVSGRHALLLWRPFTVVGLWEANPGARQWKLFTKTPLEWVDNYRMDFRSCEIAAAYDGEKRVNIIARHGWMRTICVQVNLDTKEWKMLSDGKIENRTSSTIISRSASEKRNKVVQAFHLKLKFCTAI